MKVKESSIKYSDLPETITPLDYANWRGIGENKAREIFNMADFPRIEGTGIKQLADKRAVLLHDLGLTDEQKILVLKEIAKDLVQSNLEGNK